MNGATFNLVELLIAALAPLTALLGFLALRRKKRPKTSTVPTMLPPEPPAPNQTANEVKNDDAREEADAIAAAADRNDVTADTVAGDLAWADAVRAPNRCLSAERASALIDAGCSRARAAEARLDDVTADLEAAETQRDQRTGELRSCETARALLVSQLDKQRRAVVPRWLFAVWDVAAFSTAGVTGFCVGASCAPELTVGFAVGAALLVVGRLVFEFVGR